MEIKRLSRAQIAIIRKIAIQQEESFKRIAYNRQYKQIQDELIEEGYDISTHEILEVIQMRLDSWEKVKNHPERFLEFLDDINCSMVRDYLINDYGTDNFINPNLKGLHSKLSFKESINNSNFN